MTSSGSSLSKSRSTFFSRSPPAPFHNSNRTIGHQQASPASSARITRSLTAATPFGRSMCIHEEESIKTTLNSPLTALLYEFLDSHQIRARSSVLCEFRHAFPTVEFLNGSDDCLTLCLGFGESHCVCKVAVRNIDGSFHNSTLYESIFRFQAKWNITRAVLWPAIHLLMLIVRRRR
jgi:hypothetical protein